MIRRIPSAKIIATLVLISLLTPILGACDAILPTTQKPSPVIPENITDDSSLLVNLDFIVKLPAELEDNQTMSIDILDEVTGLALNPQRIALTCSSRSNCETRISVPLGTVVKYRYLREGDVPAYEYNSLNHQVRYRIAYAESPASINDSIIAWNNTPYQGPIGRIQGRVVDKVSGLPIAASLIAVAGMETLTGSDGSFLIDQVPPGIHNLVVYSMEGVHAVFQQLAEVADQASTPADISVSPSTLIEVTFNVKPPDGTPPGIPMRLIGNMVQLGNTFADLRGGISGLASRAPLMQYQEDGTYSISLKLPEGVDLRYKYTLGDGFWNAERTASGGFKLRQIITSKSRSVINDTVDSFKTAAFAPITFRVSVPNSTPAGETISIQFNPYGWTEPLPMWPLGNNQWLYVLYSPLDMIGESAYRYCRNEQCGIADATNTEGFDANGLPFKPADFPQVIEDNVPEWTWALQPVDTITVPSEEIAIRPAPFMTGVAYAPDFHPSWQPYWEASLQAIDALSANTVVISPTWHYASANPPVLALNSGIDASWFDVGQLIGMAKQKNLVVAMHPTTGFFQPSLTWWADTKRDSNWWQTWFDRYESFLIHHADLAEQTGTQYLIIGDDNILPALPGGSIAGSASNLPGDAEMRWRAIITHIREHYKGTLAWNLAYPDGYANAPAFLDQVDMVYITVSGKLSDNPEPSSQDLSEGAANIVNNDIRAILDRFGKPIVVGLAYPSAKGAASGCVLSSDACLPATVFIQGGLEIPGVETDMKIQAETYNAYLNAIRQTDWISGVVSTGYYPPLALADQSLSVRGKPAADVLWFWYSHFTPK